MSRRSFIAELLGPEAAAELEQKLMRARMLDVLQLCADPHTAADTTCGRCSGAISKGERVFFPNNPLVSPGDPAVVWHRACYYATSSQVNEARLARSRREKRKECEVEEDPRQVALFK